jgi:predicted permease
VGDVRPMLLVLMGAVILIVILASVNLANLLLARASGRQQEMAVRMSLGATRGRMIRQMLTESVILSCAAGLAGVITATVALRFILRLVPVSVPRLTEVSVNWTVLLFALLISVLTGILFGLAPAFQSANADLVTATRKGARSSGYSTKTSRLRGLLIGSELALAMVLMVGSGLLLRTFWGLLQGNPGFNPSQVISARIWLPVPNDPKADPYAGPEKQNPFIRESLRRLSAIPGVELAAFTSSLPASLARINGTALMIEDRPTESSQDLRGEVIRISPDYFKVMQTPLVRGRFFAESDEKGKEEVAIIDESTAHRYWPTQDAIGRRLRLGRAASLPWIAVVGVVKDIKHDGLDTDGVPHIYRAVYQQGGRALSVVLRTSLPASTLEPQIRRDIQAVDPGLPVFGVRTMTEVVDASLASRRFSAALVSLFAVLALALACVGVYGLLAYTVRQRSHEIGIRMALGASAGDIRDLFLRKGITLSAAGIGAGLILAAAAAPAIATLLYGVRPIDAEVFLTVPVALLVVAALASYVPARRATKVDPMVALRES